MAEDPRIAAWRALWQALVPDNTYHHDFGFERSWRGQWQDWGYPMEAAEFPVSVNGGVFQARNFTKIGLVWWDPAKGAQVFGRPL